MVNIPLSATALNHLLLGSIYDYLGVPGASKNFAIAHNERGADIAIRNTPQSINYRVTMIITGELVWDGQDQAIPEIAESFGNFLRQNNYEVQHAAASGQGIYVTILVKRETHEII